MFGFSTCSTGSTKSLAHFEREKLSYAELSKRRWKSVGGDYLSIHQSLAEKGLDAAIRLELCTTFGV